MHRNKNSRRIIVWPVLAFVLVVAAYVLQPRMAAKEGDDSAVIRGAVRSEGGAPLYGILVKAANGPVKNAATYVYTDEKGNYEFPPLPVGAYQVSVGVAWKKPVQLTASGATQDFSAELGAGLVNQVSGVSLMKVIPGSEADKALLGESCNSCHSSTRFFLSAPSTPAGWEPIIKRMQFRLETSDWYPPAVLNADHPMHEHYIKLFSQENLTRITDFLATNITPETKFEYAAQALVRPTGEAARAVFTEWQLPKNPSDELADPDGVIWAIAGGNNVIRLDPRTGQNEIWEAPGVPKDSRFHDVTIDEHRNLWITASYLDRVFKFDTSTHLFTSWDTSETGKGWTYTEGVEKGHRTTYPHTGGFDGAGNFWVTTMGGRDSGVVKINVKTGEMKKFELPPTSKWAYTYGLEVDKEDNVWFAEHQQSKIGKLDKNGKLTEWTTPTAFNLPRRLREDSKGRIWFTESGYPAHIAMLDPPTGKITEYEYGIPSGYPYWIRVDKHDKIWFNSSDPGNVIGRFDPDTKKFTLFVTPQVDSHQINMHLDNRGDPVALLFEKPGQPFVTRMYVRP